MLTIEGNIKLQKDKTNQRCWNLLPLAQIHHRVSSAHGWHHKKHWRFGDGDGNGVGYDDGGGDGDGVAFGVCDDGGNGHPCNWRQCDALFIGTACKPQIPETQRAFCVLDLNAKNLHDGWLVLMVRFSTIILFPPVLIWLCWRSWRANFILDLPWLI